MFESIVYRKWDRVSFHDNNFSSELELKPYQYKLIRGIDFYDYCLSKLRRFPNVEILNASVDEINTGENGAWLMSGGKKYCADFLFNSILFEKPNLGSKDHYLLQHFKGWVIETPEPMFDPAVPVLMDFRMPQERGTRFAYLMPFSPTIALVEYTVFSKTLLAPDEYNRGIEKYVKENRGISSFKILSEEFGVIPMTNYRFPAIKGNIVYIGTAGGQTKASSGYTFRFIQKHAAAITHALVNTGKPFFEEARGSKRFRFYDSTLLHILANEKMPGHEIFTRLFKNNKTSSVLKFLDNDTSLREEAGILLSLPTWPFLKAALKQTFNR